MSGSSCCDCVKHKHRDVNSKEYKSMIRRLKLIEGQVRGIEKMVEEDRYCIDILIQVSAIQSALNAFNKELLAQHIHGCVVDDIRHGKDEVVDELVAAVQKLKRKIYRYGYDLQRLLQPCGKSGEQAGGNWKSKREPADQFHAGGI